MKFKIEEKPRVESVNKCIRFPKELIISINKAKGKKVNFSKFVIEACKYALDNMDE